MILMCVELRDTSWTCSGCVGTSAARKSSEAGLKALRPAALADCTWNWYEKLDLKREGNYSLESLNDKEIPA